MNEAPFDLITLTETARRLSDLQRQLLGSLKEKGPGLLLELAVRIYKFPEDVQVPLRELQSYGLVETQSVAGGQFGADLYSLTAAGERVLGVLNDPVYLRRVESAAPPLDARRQEAELLNKLGDIAKEQGDLEKALEYYQKALEIMRELSAGAGGTP